MCEHTSTCTYMPADVRVWERVAFSPKNMIHCFFQVLELPGSCPNAWSPALVTMPQGPKTTNKREGKRSRSRLFMLSGCAEMYWGFSEPGAPHRNWTSQRRGWVGWRTGPRVILGQDWRAWSWVSDKCLYTRKSTRRKHEFMMYIAQITEIICLNGHVESWGKGP